MFFNQRSQLKDARGKWNSLALKRWLLGIAVPQMVFSWVCPSVDFKKLLIALMFEGATSFNCSILYKVVICLNCNYNLYFLNNVCLYFCFYLNNIGVKLSFSIQNITSSPSF